jgi:hypothetical protein
MDKKDACINNWKKKPSGHPKMSCDEKLLQALGNSLLSYCFVLSMD